MTGCVHGSVPVASTGIAGRCVPAERGLHAPPRRAGAGHASVGGSLNSLRSSSLRRSTRETHVLALGLSSPSAALSSPSAGAPGRTGEAMGGHWAPHSEIGKRDTVPELTVAYTCSVCLLPGGPAWLLVSARAGTVAPHHLSQKCQWHLIEADQ